MYSLHNYGSSKLQVEKFFLLNTVLLLGVEIFICVETASPTSSPYDVSLIDRIAQKSTDLLGMQAKIGTEINNLKQEIFLMEKIHLCVNYILNDNPVRAKKMWDSVLMRQNFTLQDADSQLLMKKIIKDSYSVGRQNVVKIIKFILKTGLHSGFQFLLGEIQDYGDDFKILTEAHFYELEGSEIFALGYNIANNCGKNSVLFKKLPTTVQQIISGPVALQNTKSLGYIYFQPCEDDECSRSVVLKKENSADPVTEKLYVQWIFSSVDETGLKYHIKNIETNEFLKIDVAKSQTGLIHGDNNSEIELTEFAIQLNFDEQLRIRVKDGNQGWNYINDGYYPKTGNDSDTEDIGYLRFRTSKRDEINWIVKPLTDETTSSEAVMNTCMTPQSNKPSGDGSIYFSGINESQNDVQPNLESIDIALQRILESENIFYELVQNLTHKSIMEEKMTKCIESITGGKIQNLQESDESEIKTYDLDSRNSPQTLWIYFGRDIKARKLWKDLSFSARSKEESLIYLRRIVTEFYAGKREHIWLITRYINDIGVYTGFKFLIEEMRENGHLYNNPEIFTIAQFIKSVCREDSELLKSLPFAVQHIASGLITLENAFNSGFMHYRNEPTPCTGYTDDTCTENSVYTFDGSDIVSKRTLIRYPEKSHWEFIPTNDSNVAFYLQNKHRNQVLVYDYGFTLGRVCKGPFDSNCLSKLSGQFIFELEVVENQGKDDSIRIIVGRNKKNEFLSSKTFDTYILAGKKKLQGSFLPTANNELHFNHAEVQGEDMTKQSQWIVNPAETHGAPINSDESKINCK